MARRIRDALLLDVMMAYLYHFVLLGFRYWASRKRSRNLPDLSDLL